MINSPKIKVIAFYLPQYHPTPDNDTWWGKGFTEWVSVTKAKKLFYGHEQPKIPADLGFYDLRLPEIREAQATLAQQNGIYGFCYYHYYFGNGKMQLERPFQEVLASGSPSLPFCLAWANESWYSKKWNVDGISGKKLLIEQTYPGTEDFINHFQLLLPAFKDTRYITIDGKPIFMIYRPRKFPAVAEFIKTWQTLAKQNNLPGIFFVAQSTDTGNDAEYYHQIGFDAVNSLRLHEYDRNLSWHKKIKIKFFNKLLKYPKIISYPSAAQKFINPEDTRNDIFPSIISGWDHTPRSGYNGSVMVNYTPENFEQHVSTVFDAVAQKPANRCIVFLKSWNEWGEGNFVEPDQKYGHRFLEAIRKQILHYSK